MKILHVICSPRGHASQSAKRSRAVIENLLALSTNTTVTVRCLNGTNIPHIDREFALSSRSCETIHEQFGSSLLSDELIEEIVESDVVVIATPVHNLSVPSVLKAWIDHVVRPGKTFRYVDGEMVGLLSDKRIVVSLSSMGTLEGADFIRPYLRKMFAAMGLTDVKFDLPPSDNSEQHTQETRVLSAAEN